MEVKDFLPMYLEPRDENFYSSTSRAKEFSSLRLSRDVVLPAEKGQLLKHQTFISRFMSNLTTYEKLMLVHGMGTGKTCSVIGAIELIRNSHNPTKKGAVIVASANLIRKFKNDLLRVCTDGRYIPDGEEISEQALNLEIGRFYTFYTYYGIAKAYYRSDADIKKKLFDDKIIVIDEVHNLTSESSGEDEKDKEGKINEYGNIYELLHSATNTKVMLLTGTPIVDRPRDLVDPLNLLLPREEIIDKDTFEDDYFDEGKLIPEKKEELFRNIRGYISFLKASESGILKEYKGEILGDLTHTRIFNVGMGEVQAEVHRQLEDRNEEMKTYGQKEKEQISLFVFPDMTYGSKGSNKYLNKRVKRLRSSDLQKAMGIKNNTSVSDRLSVIKKHSSKYHFVINQLLKSTNKCSFVFSNLVNGSGIHILRALLPLVGFSEARSASVLQKPKKRFVYLPNAEPLFVKNMVDAFNDAKNRTGQYIQVILGSPSVSEGFSFNHIQQEFILTPHWNFTQTRQAIARGVRVGSHRYLPPNTKVEIYMMTSIEEENATKYVDYYKYIRAEDKDKRNSQLMRLMMRAAIDCSLFRDRNVRSSVYNNTSDCEYTDCNYKCVGSGEEAIRDEIETAAYRMHYLDLVDDMKHDILQYILMNGNSEKKDVETHLMSTKKYRAARIRNVVENITSSTIISLPDAQEKFLDELRLDVMGLFRKKNVYTFEEILNKIKRKDLSIIQVLINLIHQNSILLNRHGHKKYLRSHDNLYFLVDSLDSDVDTNLSFYYNNEIIDKGVKFETIKTQLNQKLHLNLINQLCNLELPENQSEADYIISQLPDDIVAVFIEKSVLKTPATQLSTYILKKYNSFLHTVNGKTVSSFLQYRYRVLTDGKWIDHPNQNDIVTKVRSLRKKVSEKIFSEYGFYGSVNPTNGKFCIVRQGDGSGEQDARKKLAGRVCTTMTTEYLLSLCDKLGITPYRNSKKSELCSLIRQKLQEQDLLIEDNTCGTTRKQRSENARSVSDDILDKMTTITQPMKYLNNLKSEGFQKKRNIQLNISERRLKRLRSIVKIYFDDQEAKLENFLLDDIQMKFPNHSLTILSRRTSADRSLPQVMAFIRENTNVASVILIKVPLKKLEVYKKAVMTKLNIRDLSENTYDQKQLQSGKDAIVRYVLKNNK